jgi:hypothetical protein
VGHQSSFDLILVAPLSWIVILTKREGVRHGGQPSARKDLGSGIRTNKHPPSFGLTEWNPADRFKILHSPSPRLGLGSGFIQDDSFLNKLKCE